MTPSRRIALLGAGNMGRALLGGLLRAGASAKALSVGEADASARSQLARELGIEASADNAAAAAGAELLILAVKPDQAAAVLVPLARTLGAARPVLLSVLAGVRVAQLSAWCGAALPVVRAMPNRPALWNAGITGLYAPPAVGAPQRALAEEAMRAVGDTLWVESEPALDAVTALSGSGPAYLFLLAECMAAAGAQLGLAPDAAQQLARATLYGAGVMAHAPGADLAQLRAQVTSVGGTTAAALAVLEAADLRGILARALAAAAARSRELAGRED
ncbi:MAG: pyrroline-5-carboxylate reductase [Gammaproteobacteria bacterium]|nr:pyrroline-5-carboxylate reductase [Gammaproteobacteria bacterium]